MSNQYLNIYLAFSNNLRAYSLAFCLNHLKSLMHTEEALTKLVRMMLLDVHAKIIEYC